MNIFGIFALAGLATWLIAPGRGGGGGGKGKRPPVPRAAPIPRPYKIHHTEHAVDRELSDRAITREMVEKAIREGQAVPTMEIGKHGGDKFTFHKAITIVNKKGQRIFRKVVVVGEVLDNNCWVVTTYNEN
ncbi:hypothetical protein OPIT5_16745 [Opitutaceae bacterium TAV5]|nr:hypothetical protein OPIT5_16745 [Opitutaceae bacterium TAV5]